MLSLGIAWTAIAQDFPSRPITLIVPFPAGGAIDTIGRIIADAMPKSLGRPVVIENVVGASGGVGVGRVARAAADGYTLGIGTWSTNVVNGAVYPLKYDMLSDLAPVALVASQPLLIVTRKGFPANNLKELIAWLRANPDKALVGTAGVGGVSHVAGVYFQRHTATSFQAVPYRGNGPALQDLVAGHIDMMIDPAASSLPQVREGNIKAYAVMAKDRLAAAPIFQLSTKLARPRCTFLPGTASGAGTVRERISLPN